MWWQLGVEYSWANLMLFHLSKIKVPGLALTHSRKIARLPCRSELLKV